MLRIEKYADTEFEKAIQTIMMMKLLYYTTHIFQMSVITHYDNADDIPEEDREKAFILSVFADIYLQNETSVLSILDSLKDYIIEIINKSHFPLGYTKSQCYALIYSVFESMSIDTPATLTSEQEYYIVSAISSIDISDSGETPRSREEFIDLMLELFVVSFGKQEEDILDELLEEIEDKYDFDDDGSCYTQLTSDFLSSDSVLEQLFDEHVFYGLQEVTPAAYAEFKKLGVFPWEKDQKGERK